MTKLQYLFVVTAALGIVAFTNNLAAADDATAAPSMPACCSGMSGCPMTTVSDTNSVNGTNAVPDLLKTCPVSGEKLGEMGKPLAFVYKGQEVKLCCKSCKSDFEKDPDKYMAKIRAADKKK